MPRPSLFFDGGGGGAEILEEAAFFQGRHCFVLLQPGGGGPVKEAGTHSQPCPQYLPNIQPHTMHQIAKGSPLIPEDMYVTYSLSLYGNRQIEQIMGPPCRHLRRALQSGIQTLAHAHTHTYAHTHTHTHTHSEGRGTYPRGVRRPEPVPPPARGDEATEGRDTSPGWPAGQTSTPAGAAWVCRHRDLITHSHQRLWPRRG